MSQENGHGIGTFICYESVFPDFIRKLLCRCGGPIRSCLTTAGSASAARYQHLKIVRMRAVENRRWILRSTNDGITAAIDPAGRLTREAPSYDAVSARVNFDYLKDTTFYTRWGDWFVALCALIALAACILGAR